MFRKNLVVLRFRLLFTLLLPVDIRDVDPPRTELPVWSKNSPPDEELIARRPLKIKQAREVSCQGRFPASFIYAIYMR